MLSLLLFKLEHQETGGLFDYSLIIVDNDGFQSARQTVESYAKESKIPISYYVEPEQNISLARNKAILNARGDFIGLIDDDELPIKQWLLNLYRELNRYKSDGILSPVLPYFDVTPPRWVLKGGFFTRPSHPNGYILGGSDTRTGNALLKKIVFEGDSEWFDRKLGSGGEDRDFFNRKIEEGFVFVWSNRAPVFEIVPQERLKRTVQLKRALLRGKMALNTTKSKPASVIKSAVAVFFYSSLLPLFFFIGHHLFMKYLIKDCDHLGKVLAFFDINLVKEKYVSS